MHTHPCVHDCGTPVECDGERAANHDERGRPPSAAPITWTMAGLATWCSASFASPQNRC